jgi:hypothetical protein
MVVLWVDEMAERMARLKVDWMDSKMVELTGGRLAENLVASTDDL